jgi:hypothetical protein
VKIAELPFVEKPVAELLNLVEDRELPDHDYAGFGWAKVDSVWLTVGEEHGRRIDDALVLALHSPDDAENIAGDVELEFELPTGAVSVLASKFLEVWLPKLPRASNVVLALCNPHGATLVRPAGVQRALWYGAGDVESWREDDRVLLTADAWRTV